MRRIYSVLFALVVLISCAKEDPQLVNPPPPYQSIRVRLLNGVNTDDNIAWGYNNSIYSEGVPYLSITKSKIPPPFDSIKVEFYQNNRYVYSTNRKIRLIRETRYLIIAGRSFKDGATVDTFMVLSTTYGLPKRLGKSYFKFVNLVRDSTLKATLVEGCPNGKPLISEVSYFNYPFLQTIPYGNYTISVLLKKGITWDLFNIYSINFEEDNEYTIFLAQKRDGTLGLFLYNDYDTNATNLTELNPIGERVSYIRTVNFTEEKISLLRFPSQLLMESIEPKKISKFLSLSACESKILDSLEVSSSGGSSFIGYSFDIFKRYTLLVFDSLNGGKKLIVVPPVELKEQLSGRSLIRVVNSVDTNFAFTLSLGARNVHNSNGFSAGDILSSNLKSNKISTPVLIEPGYLPLTLFSSTEPAFLVKSVFAEVKPDKSYLIIITKTSSGKIELALLPDDAQDTDVSFLESGCFVQVLNAYPFASTLKFTIPNYLQNIRLNYKESFATVLPASVNTISVNDISNSISLDLNKTGLLVITGNDSKYQLFDISIPSMGKEMNSFRRRFFNASYEIDDVGIFYDSSRKNVVVDGLKYGSFSKPERVFLERKFSLVFFDNLRNTILAQFNDIYLSFGKNYTLVFSGSKTRGFSLIVVQEY